MNSTAHPEISVDQKAETGGTVNDPVLIGNTITSLIFNYNTAGTGTFTLTVLTETYCFLAIS